MHLSGEERKQLRNAIISAYRSQTNLEIMVGDELEPTFRTSTVTEGFLLRFSSI